MAALDLPGLRADVPATHLAALGLLRGLDRHGLDARLAWAGSHARLDGPFIGTAELARWLAHDWTPVPIVAPWQVTSCYADATKNPRTHQLPLEEAALAGHHRLDAYRRTFEALDRRVLPRFGTRLGGDAPPDLKKRKAEVLTACRTWLPDEALSFTDLAAVIPADGADPVFGPALGGTGGMDGNLSIDTRYLRALTLLGAHEPVPTEHAGDWADALLTGHQAPRLSELPDGLLNASSTDEADGAPTKIGFANNPWLTILGLEGMLLLAGSVHTRESGPEAAFPWTVRSSARQGGEGAMDVYVPVWEGWRDAGAVADLYARGRLRVRARPVSDVAGVTAAVREAGARLGVRRFEEFRLTKRRGGNPNLTRVGALVVPREAREGALLADLAPLLGLGRQTGRPAWPLLDRAETLIRDPDADLVECLAAAGWILRFAERRRPHDPPTMRLSLSWRWALHLRRHALGRVALAAAQGLAARLALAGSQAARDRAAAVLVSPRPLVDRLLDAPARPLVPQDVGGRPAPGGGLTLDELWSWYAGPGGDGDVDALLAVFRRGLPTAGHRGTGVWRLGARRAGAPPAYPRAVVGTVLLAAQPPPAWDAPADDQPLVTVRRQGLAAGYEIAVRRLHRLDVPAPRLPVPTGERPEPRLACALALPAHAGERTRLAHELFPTATPRHDAPTDLEEP